MLAFGRMVRFAERQRRLTRAEYERAVDAGLFRGEHVELIHGIVVRMSPRKDAHATVVQILTRLLMPALVGRADVRVQTPFAASDDSMPEPDLAVVAVARFNDPHPRTAHLIIEVAETSLAEDRSEKAELYASANVPECWIVNIPDRIVEVHTEPSRGAYTRLTPYRAGETVKPKAFADVSVEVAQLFS